MYNFENCDRKFAEYVKLSFVYTNLNQANAKYTYIHVIYI